MPRGVLRAKLRRSEARPLIVEYAGNTKDEELADDLIAAVENTDGVSPGIVSVDDLPW